MSFFVFLTIGAFFISMICGFIAIPYILNYCKDKKLYDLPNARKIHRIKVPRLGGVAFMPSMIVASLIALFVLKHEYQSQRIEINLWSLYFMISLIMIYSIGLIDDLFGLSANIKFVIQVIAASLLPAAGLYINNLYGLFGIYEISFWIGAPLTVLIIVFIDNAMNLIDGIDGLCASLSLLALCGFLYLFWREGLVVYCIIIAGLAGVLIPYLYFNLFGQIEKGMKIFMGDSGSLTLGFILGFLFVKFTMDNKAVMPYCDDRLVMSYSLLIVPTFDVVRVVIHRLKTHRPLFEADKNHIHHKLMNIGLNMHQTLMVILLFAVSFLVLNNVLYLLTSINVVFIADIFIYTLFHLTINLINSHKKREESLA